MHFGLLVLLFFAFSFNIGATAKLSHAPVDNEEHRVFYDQFIELDRSLKNVIGHGIKMVLPYIMEANEHLNLSSGCMADIFQLISGLKSLKMSSIRILDASAKIPSGFVAGSNHMLGDYDECLRTDVLRKDGTVGFRGQYCMLHVRPILPGRIKLTESWHGLVEHTKNTSELMRFIVPLLFYTYDFPMKVGICAPSGCSSNDVTSISKYLGEQVYVNATLQYCDLEHKRHFYTGTIIAIVAFSLVGLLCLIGSLLDHISRKKMTTFQSASARLLMCFSVISNFPKVISTKTSEKTLTSIFGVRSLSLFYIILNHQYFCQGKLNISGHMIDIVLKSIPTFFFQISINGVLTTEVFFFIGGLLNTYTRMKIYESRKRELSKTQMVIHRLWRIYPAYLFGILSFFLFMDAYGPLGTQVRKQFLEKCETNWWQNILFINNFFVQTETCMPHSWYIAADMQLFLLSLFTVPLLLRNAKRGLILHTGILVSGIAMTALWAWHKNLMPGYLIYNYNEEEVYKVWNAYATALPHIAPYFTGLISGYILFKWKDFAIPTICQIIGWPIASAAFISMLFMTSQWNSGVEYTILESSLYFAFSRFLFTLAVAWLVVCCTWGYGGILNYILSLKIWVPITRISYMVYLTSLPVQMNFFASSTMLIDSDRTTLIWRYIGDLGVACLLGLAMVVVVESPFIVMEKMLFRRQSTAGKDNEETAEDQKRNTEIGKTLNGLELQKSVKNTTVNFQLK